MFYNMLGLVRMLNTYLVNMCAILVHENTITMNSNGANEIWIAICNTKKIDNSAIA